VQASLHATTTHHPQSPCHAGGRGFESRRSHPTRSPASRGHPSRRAFWCTIARRGRRGHNVAGSALRSVIGIHHTPSWSSASCANVCTPHRSSSRSSPSDSAMISPTGPSMWLTAVRIGTEHVNVRMACHAVDCVHRELKCAEQRGIRLTERYIIIHRGQCKISPADRRHRSALSFRLPPWNWQCVLPTTILDVSD
jgi:hypothetical protein